MLRIQCLSAALLLAAGTASARPIAADGYAATVNRRVILLSDVRAVVYPVQQQLRQTFSGQELEDKLQEAYGTALQNLIERALILEEFDRRGLTFPDRMVDAHVNNLVKDRFDDNRLEFLDALAQERMTLDEWRQQAKESLIVNELRRMEVSQSAAVAPRDVLAYYELNKDRYRTPEQVHLRLILLNAGATEEERAVKRQEAEQLRARIEAGEDFAALARSRSEGARAAQGGDRGWLEPSTLQAELARAVADLPSGGVSQVVETPEAFYLARVEGRKQASLAPLDEVRADIEALLLQREEERLHEQWIARLKRRFYVHIFEP